jgi:hypothetical protein
MSIDWKRAVQAGIVGTVVFDLLGLVLTGRWGVPMLLGAKLGIGLMGGAVAHYTNGVCLPSSMPGSRRRSGSPTGHGRSRT